MSVTYKYPRPALTVDVVAFRPDKTSHELLLIKRGIEPYKGSWALPGGFVEMDEELIDAAARELEEETGIRNLELKQLGSYGKVDRDPRGRTVSVVYVAFLPENSNHEAQAGDDAAEADWFSLAQLPTLAFDHADIVRDAIVLLKKRTGF